MSDYLTDKWVLSCMQKIQKKLEPETQPAPTVALVELSKWRVWKENGSYKLGHATDGDSPTPEEWEAIGRELKAMALSKPLTADEIRNLRAYAEHYANIDKHVAEAKSSPVLPRSGAQEPKCSECGHTAHQRGRCWVAVGIGDDGNDAMCPCLAAGSSPLPPRSGETE